MNEILRHLGALAKSGAAAFPLGSSVVTAINEYVPSAHDRKNQQAAEALYDRLVALGDRIDADYVRSDQFVDLFKNCYFITQRTQHEEKLRAAGNILTNMLLKVGDLDKLNYDELDHFTRCVENLSLGALHVLGKAIEYAEKHGHGQVSRTNVLIDFHRLLGFFPDADRDVLMGFAGELSSCNLLHSRGGGTVTIESDRYGTYHFETTPLGFRFVKFILEPGAE